MSGGASTGELMVRLFFSLGVIVGLLLLAARMARRSGGALRLPGFGGRNAAVKVLERHSLSKTASLAVVQIGERTMVVGITDHTVSVLADGPAPDGPAPTAPDAATPAGAAVAATLDLDLDTAAAADPVDPTPREAKRTLPLGPPPATAVAPPGRPPRMSFVEALRELTVRKA